MTKENPKRRKRTKPEHPVSVFEMLTSMSALQNDLSLITTAVSRLKISTPVLGSFTTGLAASALSGSMLDIQMQEVQRLSSVIATQTQYLGTQLAFTQYATTYQSLLADLSQHFVSLGANLAFSPNMPVLTAIGQWQQAFQDMRVLSGIMTLSAEQLDKYRVGISLPSSAVALVKPFEGADKYLLESKHETDKWKKRFSGPLHEDESKEDRQQANGVLDALCDYIEVLQRENADLKRKYEALLEAISKAKPIDDEPMWG